MAIIRNHPVKATLKKAVDYCMNDKTDSNADQCDPGIIQSASYVTRDKISGSITYRTQSSFINCRGEDDFIRYVSKYQKANEDNPRSHQTKDRKQILAWHYIQSFDEVIVPDVSNRIGRELAIKCFPNFKVIISTHTNTEHTHNHILVSAWDLNGKKWHQCNRNYQLIREESDRLCEKYGLKVLDQTKQQHLMKYDVDGKEHYFEPTDRKVQMLSMREKGILDRGADVSSYRNTNQYHNQKNAFKSERDIVRKDIDELLPISASFDDLVQRMRSAGYIIKDKKKNGDYLAHISFLPPGFVKPVRDNSLDPYGRYTRASLEEIILRNHSADRQNRKADRDKKAGRSDIPAAVPYIADYSIFKTRISELNADYKSVKDKNGKLHVVKRGRLSHDVINDVHSDFSHLAGVYPANVCKGAYNSYMTHQRISDQRIRSSLQRIEFKMNCLNFIEHRELTSYDAIEQSYSLVTKQYHSAKGSLIRLGRVVEDANKARQMIYQARAIEQRISFFRHDSGYQEIDLQNDKESLRLIKENLAHYGIKDLTSSSEEFLRKSERTKSIYLSKDREMKLLEKEMDQFEYFRSYITQLKTEAEVIENQLIDEGNHTELNDDHDKDR